MATITKRTFATVMASTATGLEPSMTISTSSVDRDRDIIEPEGGVFGPYLRNPLVGWQHFRDDAMPIGSTIRLDVVKDGIRATWRWLEGDPLADRVRNAYQQGVVRAASIGFLPLAWEPLPGGGRRYTKWELSEWSLCAVPSNREAVRVLRSLDLWRADGDDEPTLEIDDGDESFELPDADDPDDLVLDVAEDEPVDVDPRELGRAIAEVLRDTVSSVMADHVGRAVRRELDRHRGRLVEDDAPWLTADADIARVRRAETRQQFDVTNDELAAAMREVVPGLVHEAIRDAVGRGLRAARGRLD